MALDTSANGVLLRLMSEIPSKYSTDEGSVLYDIMAAAAIEFEAAYSAVDDNIKRNLISEASGSDLDALLSQLGYYRKNATYAEGEVTICGTDGTVIPTGTLIAKGRIIYETTADATVSGGSAVVHIRAQLPGESGNATVGTVNYFPVMPENLLSVSNAEAVTGGTNTETDNAYRERYFYFLDNPVTSGNKYEYEQWAMEVDGVGKAKCYPIWNGPGTVKVVIATAAMEPAGSDLVQAVAAHIEEQRLVGPTVTVSSAEAVSVNVSATVYTDGAYSPDSVRLNLSDALTAYFKDLGFSGGVVPYSEVGAILQNIPGVMYYSDFKLNGAQNNITISDGQLAAIGTINLTQGA